MVISAAESSKAVARSAVDRDRDEGPVVEHFERLGRGRRGERTAGQGCSRASFASSPKALAINASVEGSKSDLAVPVERSRHLLAELDAELVERVDAEQRRIGEGPVLVKGDQGAQVSADRGGRAGSSSTAGRPDRDGADPRRRGPPSRRRPGRSNWRAAGGDGRRSRPVIRLDRRRRTRPGPDGCPGGATGRRHAARRCRRRPRPPARWRGRPAGRRGRRSCRSIPSRAAGDRPGAAAAARHKRRRARVPAPRTSAVIKVGEGGEHRRVARRAARSGNGGPSPRRLRAGFRTHPSPERRAAGKPIDDHKRITAANALGERQDSGLVDAELDRLFRARGERDDPAIGIPDSRFLHPAQAPTAR